jgi:hypothetical protein
VKQKRATLPTTSTDSPSKKKQSSNNQSKRNVIEDSGGNYKGNKTNSKTSLVGQIINGLNA